MKTLKKLSSVTVIFVTLISLFYGCSKSTSDKTNNTENKNLKTASNKGTASPDCLRGNFYR